MTATADDLVRERHGAVLCLRINRPDSRNALTPAMMCGIGAAVRAAESDPEIRAMVLTGAGERAFCSGMDLQSFAEGDPIIAHSPDMHAFHRFGRGETAIPVVGAANGAAVGGGLELLLGCDVIVASTAATFGLPEVKRGFFPGGGGTLLGTRIPLAVALELTLTGDLIDAERACGLGLINSVAPPGQVLAVALGLAERIAANAPLGLAACKELVRLGVTDAARAGERLDHWRRTVFGSADAKEGAAAFVEKRAPRWQGR
jgi:enoyl-CoA hydratase/carnithine racemase